MSKLHIKKGDTVYVNAGEDKGKTGRVLKVLVKDNKAIVEGVNMVSKHTKPNAKAPQGGIVKKEAPIHLSNLNSIACLAGFCNTFCKIFHFFMENPHFANIFAGALCFNRQN